MNIAITRGVSAGIAACELTHLERQAIDLDRFTALLYPVPLIFFFVVFFWSVLRSGRTVTWKGRQLYGD